MLLEVVRPALEAGDARALAQAVSRHWDPIQLCGFLRHHDTDVRRVAAVVLGLVGDRRVIDPLAAALRDPDRQVNEMAEHSLWSLWFRCCGTRACGPFREGIALLEAERYPEAVRKFKHASRLDPDFAESYNQCAIAHFFLGQWDAVIECCQEAIRRVPQHFGATAGMGHAYAQIGDLTRALACYRKALEINPRIPAIAKAIERIGARQQSLEFRVSSFE